MKGKRGRGRVLVAVVALAGALVGIAAAPPVAAAPTQPFNLTWGTAGSANGQFDTPRGIAFDLSGNVYVADRSNHRIQEFGPTGAFIRKWGTQGAADGQFNAPSDVAVDASGNVYVADTVNSRIQEFTSTGTFIRKWGTAGTGDGQFASPLGVVVSNTGAVYVADTGNNRIQQFTSTGAFTRKWGSLGAADGLFNSPRDVAFSPFFADLYVADAGNHRVQRFSSTGVFEVKWGSSGTGNGQFNSPRALAEDPLSHEIVVADTFNNRVQRFDSNGAFQEVVGASGSGNGQFSNPTGIGVDALGNVFVADTLNSRVERFGSIVGPLPLVSTWSTGASPRRPGLDVDGNLYVPVGLAIKKFAPDGTLLGSTTVGTQSFETPEAVAVDAAGVLYVARPGSIGVFTQAGSVVRVIGGGDGINTPNEVLISPLNGHVYFSDDIDSSVREYTTTGTFVRRIVLQGASGIASDAAGNLYVSSTDDLIHELSATGAPLGTFGSSGTGIGQFTGAAGVAMDPQGDVLVVDSFTNRLQEFTTAGVLLSQRAAFSGPVGVAADASGNVYVADTGHGRVQRFATSGTLRGVVAGQGSGTYVLAMQVGSFALVRGTYTDASSNYTMTVPPGRYIVGYVDPSGTKTFEWFNDKLDISQVGPNDFVTVPAGGLAFANATLASNGFVPPPTPATLSGTVSGPSGGVANAFVYAVDLNSGRSKGVKANASGQYTITGLPASSGYRVIFIDPTNATLAEWFDNHAQTDLANATVVTLTAGATTNLSVTLADNPTV